MSNDSVQLPFEERTVHGVDLKDGHSMAIVERGDDSYGLAYDGKVIAGLTWPPDQRDECVDVFEHFVFTHGGAKN